MINRNYNPRIETKEIEPWVPPKPPKRHRLLSKGEVIKEGTKILFGQEWLPVTSVTINDVVKNYLGYAYPV